MSLTFFPAIPVECYGDALNEVESHSVENPLYDATLNGQAPGEDEPDTDAYKWTRSRRMTPRAIHGSIELSEVNAIRCHFVQSWYVKRLYDSPFPVWPLASYEDTSYPAPTARTENNQYEFVATELYRRTDNVLMDDTNRNFSFFVTEEEKAGTLPGYPSPYIEDPDPMDGIYTAYPNYFAYYSLIPKPGTPYPGGRYINGDPLPYPNFPTTAEDGNDLGLGDYQWFGFVEFRNATQATLMVRYPQIGTQFDEQAAISTDTAAISRAVPYCLQSDNSEDGIDVGFLARAAFNKFGSTSDEDDYTSAGADYASNVTGVSDPRSQNDLRQRGAFRGLLGHAPAPMFPLDAPRAVNLAASSRGILAPGDQFMTGFAGSAAGVKIDIPLVEVYLGIFRPTLIGAPTDGRAHLEWPGIVRAASFSPTHWFMPIGFSPAQALRLLPDVISGFVTATGWTAASGIGGTFTNQTYLLFALDRSVDEYVLERRNDAWILEQLIPPTGYEDAITYLRDWLNAQIAAITEVGAVEVRGPLPVAATDDEREVLSSQPLFGLPGLGTFSVRFMMAESES